MPEVIESFNQPDTNRFFIKTFLIDDSVNNNKSGIVSDYIHKHINKFKGRPLIITDYLKHPHAFYHIPEGTDHQANINMYLELQKQYEIGKILEVKQRNIIQNTNSSIYDAIVEITDPKAIEAFKNGKIPKYVSPSIYRLNTHDPPSAITDFEPINLTIVDDPAYGFEVANVSKACNGEVNTCTRLLSQNSSLSSSSSYDKLQNLFTSSSFSSTETQYPDIQLSESNSSSAPQSQQQQQQPQPQSQQKTNSQSQPTVTTPVATTMVTVPNVPAQVTTINPVTNEQKTEDVKVPEAKSTVAVDTNKIETPPSQPAMNDNNNSDNSNTPCAKTIALFNERLDKSVALIETLSKKVEDLSAYKENTEKSIAEVRANSKRDKISRIVTIESSNGNEDERNKRIESLMTLPDDQLDHFMNTYVIPMTRNLKQSGTFRPSRISELIDTSGNSSTKNLQQSANNKGVSSKDIRDMKELIEFASIVDSNHTGVVS